MIGGFGFPFNGFGGVVNPAAFTQGNQFRVKQLCIFELPTTNVSLSEESVDFGIDRCIYNALPCDCYISLRVNHLVPEGGEALPITIVVPNSSNSTNTGSTTANNGETNIGVIDHNSDPVVGADLETTTEVFAFLSKGRGIIRFVNFETGGGAEAAGTTTTTTASE